jgi:hypothetical protein
LAARSAGPVIKDRTHFFGGYEGTRRSDGSTQVLTVPTDLQRGGDFSQTFNVQGTLLRVFDPLSNQTVGNTVTRHPIPRQRDSAKPASTPVSRQLLDFWPRPNKAPVNLAGAQNFSANRAQRFDRDNVTIARRSRLLERQPLLLPHGDQQGSHLLDQ